MKRLRFPLSALSVLFVAALAMSGPAPLSAQKASPDKSKTIYVADFELDAQNVQPDEGPGGRSGVLHGSGPVRRATGHGTGDPAQQAQQIVNLMSDSIVSEFQKAGYIAQRVAPDSTSIGAGYLVKGVFTEVDQGNRVRRAVIGFGAGEVNMQLYVNVSDAAHPQENLYTLDKDDTSGKKPGAVITMNPIAAGAKFMMEKNASDKVVKKTAKQISDEVVQRINSGTVTAVKLRTLFAARLLGDLRVLRRVAADPARVMLIDLTKGPITPRTCPTHKVFISTGNAHLSTLGLHRCSLTGADADAARVRALAAYKDFLALWKDADPDTPS